MKEPVLRVTLYHSGTLGLKFLTRAMKSQWGWSDMDKKISEHNLIREQDGKKLKIIKQVGPNKSDQCGKFFQNS